ncbi:uncharacterized protein LOC9633771 [Selaginella moellendorffii]|nr:uncharacterized protein LOC9633771 [Selaginella moellendorffii]|eukprot:XP_002991038.2 uncharacterized protein LOC9633771 [Selaginella moellendorffii]
MLGFRRSGDRFQCGKDSSIQQQLPRLGSTSNEWTLASSDSRRMKKVLVSGLPDFLDSEGLFCFFEQNFGPVLDAVVLPFHSADGQRGRFGVVTFKNKNAFLEAIRMKSGYIFGKKAMIDIVEARVSRDLLPPADENSKRQFGEDAPPASLMHSPSLPPWAQRFRDWLPGFLAEVSKRLAKGEAYPLCSLKGDFRATCGLEMDHASLGFEKLRDFIRAWPEICEPKLVPVGSGPATHIVLERVMPDTATEIQQREPTFGLGPQTRSESVLPATETVIQQPDPGPSQPPQAPPSDVVQGSLLSRNVLQDLYNENIPTLRRNVLQDLHNVENVPPPPPSTGTMRNVFDNVEHNTLPPSTGVLCNICKEEALWSGIPCRHLVLCDSCKKCLDKCGQTRGMFCPVCHDPVESMDMLRSAGKAPKMIREDDAPASLEGLEFEKLSAFIRAWPKSQLVPVGPGPAIDRVLPDTAPKIHQPETPAPPAYMLRRQSA